MKINSKILFICVMSFFLAIPVFASETTGNLCTGIGCPVQGTVVAAPTASPVAGTYNATQNVTLSASGATSIRYTLDSSTPTCASTQYASAVSITASKTIKAIACYPNSVTSTVATFAYVLQCATQSVTNGSVGAYPTCAISCNSGYTLSGGSCVASGGGGGGGGGGGSYYTPSPIATTTITTTTQTTGGTQSTVAALQAQLNALIAQLNALTGGSATVGTVGGGYQFPRSLTVGYRGEDVRQLQLYLNSHGFPLAVSGPGSPENETLVFGYATRAALAKFQASVGISPAVGYFGSITRTYINSHP